MLYVLCSCWFIEAEIAKLLLNKSQKLKNPFTSFLAPSNCESVQYCNHMLYLPKLHKEHIYAVVNFPLRQEETVEGW